MKSFFEKCKRDVELSPYTTFRIGGKADYFFIAENSDDLIEAIRAARDENIDYYILSGGSNVLISDKGFCGLVIKINNKKLEIKDDIVKVDAGVISTQLLNFSLDNDLCGLEFLAGIPGTVGGAICGNAGAYGKEIKDYLKSVEYLDLDSMKIEEKEIDELDFEYRSSDFKNKKNKFILSASLKLDKCDDTEKAKDEVKKLIADRLAKLPKEPSAGCVFKNIVIKESEIINDDLKKHLNEFKHGKIPAGWLIEKCGLKGEEIGGAKISDQHANFIINTGGAKSSDVMKLIKLIKLKIKEKFGVEMELEIVLVGFDE